MVVRYRYRRVNICHRGFGETIVCRDTFFVMINGPRAPTIYEFLFRRATRVPNPVSYMGECRVTISVIFFFYFFSTTRVFLLRAFTVSLALENMTTSIARINVNCILLFGSTQACRKSVQK